MNEWANAKWNDATDKQEENSKKKKELTYSIRLTIFNLMLKFTMYVAYELNASNALFSFNFPIYLR